MMSRDDRTGVATDRMADDGDDGLVDGLLGVTQRVENVVAAVAVRHDLTPQQVRLLRMLDAPVSMRACAEDRSCDPSNVTGLVDRAERLGLVERIPDPRDRRVRLLTLTPKGRQLRDLLNRDIAAGLRDLLSLSQDDIPDAARLLGAMNASTSRRAGAPDPRC